MDTNQCEKSVWKKMQLLCRNRTAPWTCHWTKEAKTLSQPTLANLPSYNQIPQNCNGKCLAHRRSCNYSIVVSFYWIWIQPQNPSQLVHQQAVPIYKHCYMRWNLFAILTDSYLHDVQIVYWQSKTWNERTQLSEDGIPSLGSFISSFIQQLTKIYRGPTRWWAYRNEEERLVPAPLKLIF